MKEREQGVYFSLNIFPTPSLISEGWFLYSLEMPREKAQGLMKGLNSIPPPIHPHPMKARLYSPSVKGEIAALGVGLSTLRTGWKSEAVQMGKLQTP